MKMYKLYQITKKGPWYLKELREDDDGRVGWLNTYDENEAMVLDVNTLMTLCLTGLRHGLNISVKEVTE